MKKYQIYFIKRTHNHVVDVIQMVDTGWYEIPMTQCRLKLKDFKDRKLDKNVSIEHSYYCNDEFVKGEIIESNISIENLKYYTINGKEYAIKKTAYDSDNKIAAIYVDYVIETIYNEAECKEILDAVKEFNVERERLELKNSVEEMKKKYESRIWNRLFKKKED